MLRQSSITIILLLASLGARSFAIESTDSPDSFDGWEPVYSIPHSAPEKGDATITLIEPNTELMILGKSEISHHAICKFIRQNNPDFSEEIAKAYIKLGETYGIRGDIALCQAIIETGWFKFADGTAVTIDQHNYCGLGVTRRGVKGASFDTIEDGVRAHLQHLFAYASTSPIPKGEKLLDPRFTLVMRGVARTWDDLSNRWAMNPNYGKQIYDLYQRLLQYTNLPEK